MAVEQVDREAAADIWRDYVARVGEVMVERGMREGTLDDGLPSLLAAHRERERERCVSWLREQAKLCDCFAHEPSECACGAWDDCKQANVNQLADELAVAPRP